MSSISDQNRVSLLPPMSPTDWSLLKSLNNIQRTTIQGLWKVIIAGGLWWQETQSLKKDRYRSSEIPVFIFSPLSLGFDPRIDELGIVNQTLSAKCPREAWPCSHRTRKKGYCKLEKVVETADSFFLSLPFPEAIPSQGSALQWYSDTVTWEKTCSSGQRSWEKGLLEARENMEEIPKKRQVEKGIPNSV